MHRWYILNASLALTDITLDVFPYVPLVVQMWERAMNFQWLSCKKKKNFFHRVQKFSASREIIFLAPLREGRANFGEIFVLQWEIIILGCKFGNCHHQFRMTLLINYLSCFYHPPWPTGWVCHAQSRLRWRTKSSWCAIHCGKSASGSLSLRFAEVGRVKTTKSLPWQQRAWWKEAWRKSIAKNPNNSVLLCTFWLNSGLGPFQRQRFLKARSSGGTEEQLCLKINVLAGKVHSGKKPSFWVAK